MATLRTSSQALATTSSRRTLTVTAAYQRVGNKSELAANGGRKVFEVGGQKVLVAEVDGAVFAVSNKCSHLGLPLVGKTALLQGKVVDKCIVCPAHGTAYDLASGAVKGKWCPSLPEAVATGFGMTPPKPLPTFQSRVLENGDIEVDV